MDLGLNGARALVTGSTAGIGAAIAETLAREGCHVAICSRSQDKVDSMLERLEPLPGHVIGRALDVSDHAAFSGWVGDVTDAFGGLDIFVPNVSAMTADWQAMVDTDIHGTVAEVDAVLPYLLDSDRAAIVYISSIAGLVGAPPLAAYGAIKAAMSHYMKSLSMKLVKKGVRVNAVAPGDILFPGGIWDRVQQGDPDQFARVLKRNPMGRLGTPQEIANTVAFLASPAASFITGSQVVVDGGNTQHVQG